MSDWRSKHSSSKNGSICGRKNPLPLFKISFSNFNNRIWVSAFTVTMFGTEMLNWDSNKFLEMKQSLWKDSSSLSNTNLNDWARFSKNYLKLFLLIYSFSFFLELLRELCRLWELFLIFSRSLFWSQSFSLIFSYFVANLIISLFYFFTCILYSLC